MTANSLPTAGSKPERKIKDIVLVLAGIHAATQFIAGGPERRIEIGFFDGHEGSCSRLGDGLQLDLGN